MSYTYRQMREPVSGEIDVHIIQRIEDGAFIPFDEGNYDYREYLAWVADGNTPEAPA